MPWPILNFTTHRHDFSEPPPPCKICRVLECLDTCEKIQNLNICEYVKTQTCFPMLHFADRQGLGPGTRISRQGRGVNPIDPLVDLMSFDLIPFEVSLTDGRRAWEGIQMISASSWLSPSLYLD